jgi:hypothetical protein
MFLRRLRRRRQQNTVSPTAKIKITTTATATAITAPTGMPDVVIFTPGTMSVVVGALAIFRGSVAVYTTESKETCYRRERCWRLKKLKASPANKRSSYLLALSLGWLAKAEAYLNTHEPGGQGLNSCKYHAYSRQANVSH